jgi:hypothetical protein
MLPSFSAPFSAPFFFVNGFKQPGTSDQGKVVALERKSAGELARSLYSLH